MGYLLFVFYGFRNALLACLLIMLGYSQTVVAVSDTIRFAAIGDYGAAGPDEQKVAELIATWEVDFIITLGDNNYEDGAAETMDDNVGQYYQEYIGGYTGEYGSGSETNRFFPSLGNHDWRTKDPENPASNLPQVYLDYFPSLPGNGRYYRFTQGAVEFFAIDSDVNEPDGNTFDSVQGEWLKAALADSTADWKIVYMHHSPYSSENSSSLNGSQPDLQWPYEEWGADAVIASHDHVYERLFVGEIPYFVNGVGGRSVRTFGKPIPQSRFQYNADYGAMLITADSESILYEFYSVAEGGILIDSYRQLKRTTVISSGSVWFYLDNGTDQGTAWKESGFDDSNWSSGAAQLGYGDGDEATIVSFGDNASNKPITTYFRHSFNVSNSADVTALSLNLLRDDGAIVYLNGTEIVRSNLPADTITYTTQALTGIAPADESVYSSYDLAPDLLQDGVNVVAVEVHQNSPDSSDLSFDLSLSSTGISSSVDTTAPSIPESFAGTAESGSQIDLSWQASTDNGAGVAGYRLFRDGVEIGTSSTINYTDTGLTAETAYSYTVAAYDAADPANESAQSEAVSVTTLSSTSNPDTTAPSIPESLAGIADSGSQIDLSWQASTDSGAGGVAGYRLFRDGVEIGTSSTTNYSDTGLTAGTTYSYSIAAYDAADPTNESAQSAAVIVKTLSSLTNDSDGGGADSDGGGALSIFVLIAGLWVALLLRKRYQRVSAKS